MLVYPSTIDLSSRTLRHLSGLLAGHRRRIGSRWRRLTCGRQALLVLAHLRCGDTYARLAAAFRIGIATAYRYIRQAVDLLADLAPTLDQAMETVRKKAYVILDGTVLPIERIAADRPYSGDVRARHCRSIAPKLLLSNMFRLWLPSAWSAWPKHSQATASRTPARFRCRWVAGGAAGLRSCGGGLTETARVAVLTVDTDGEVVQAGPDARVGAVRVGTGGGHEPGAAVPGTIGAGGNFSGRRCPTARPMRRSRRGFGRGVWSARCPDGFSPCPRRSTVLRRSPRW